MVNDDDASVLCNERSAAPPEEDEEDDGLRPWEGVGRKERQTQKRHMRWDLRSKQKEKYSLSYLSFLSCHSWLLPTIQPQLSIREQEIKQSLHTWKNHVDISFFVCCGV